ncbi:MAG TPA: UDP-N-acetylmuramoyl-L-alanyl-D-glutamate--2,6-diaminopimelate ligase [Candidatus Marinimicrobia bacterium]|nr:UDP-N-acetylmuramoyl-L-alanyl-D-glutamate--2,6-diaminopimelate ligase [Candidatus Neomarinimicrobiota bacterium]
MMISQLIDGIKAKTKWHIPNLEVKGLAYDSRKVQPGDFFVAWKGQKSDGHHYVQEAIRNGAAAILCERWLPVDFPQIKVADSRREMSLIASRLYNTEKRKLRLICVTGTNGKTTTTYLFRALGKAAGIKTASIGTLGIQSPIKIPSSPLTTPESADLHRSIHLLDKSGLNALIIEGSSIAFEQGRLDYLSFDVTGFTNLTQDHLDYHETMEAYYQAKKGLIDMREKGASAVINTDDDYGNRLLKEIKPPIDAISIKMNLGDFYFKKLELLDRGINASLKTPSGELRVELPIIGDYNASNLLMAVALYHRAGLPVPDYLGAQDFDSIPGRMEIISTKKGTAVIDFAHSPDAIEQVCKTLRKLIKNAKLITVMGAGGDRDNSKRPAMSHNAGRWSDVLILTNDNPRSEAPEKILKELKYGLNTYTGEVRLIADRREAINFALDRSQPGDIIAILGKGAEEYQEIMNVKHRYRDQDVVLDWKCANETE